MPFVGSNPTPCTVVVAFRGVLRLYMQNANVRFGALLVIANLIGPGLVTTEHIGCRRFLVLSHFSKEALSPALVANVVVEFP
jgi:hypothetical protein